MPHATTPKIRMLKSEEINELLLIHGHKDASKETTTIKSTCVTEKPSKSRTVQNHHGSNGCLRSPARICGQRGHHCTVRRQAGVAEEEPREGRPRSLGSFFFPPEDEEFEKRRCHRAILSFSFNALSSSFLSSSLLLIRLRLERHLEEEADRNLVDGVTVAAASSIATVCRSRLNVERSRRSLRRRAATAPPASRSSSMATARDERDRPLHCCGRP